MTDPRLPIRLPLNERVVLKPGEDGPLRVVLVATRTSTGRELRMGSEDQWVEATGWGVREFTISVPFDVMEPTTFWAEEE